MQPSTGSRRRSVARRGWKVPSRSKEELFVNAYRDGSIERWARAGATDRQIAESIGLSYTTYYKYLNEYPNVLDTIQSARKPVVTEAFEGLVRLSRGFEHTVTRQSKKEVLTSEGKVVTLHEAVQETRYYPPNHQACTKVIVNYLNHINRKKDGVPDEYVSEPEAMAADSKQGRLPEMEEALKCLFFGDGKDD